MIPVTKDRLIEMTETVTVNTMKMGQNGSRTIYDTVIPMWEETVTSGYYGLGGVTIRHMVFPATLPTETPKGAVYCEMTRHQYEDMMFPMVEFIGEDSELHAFAFANGMVIE